MAVRFDTSDSNNFSRTSDLIDYRAAHTWMGWVYFTGNGASWPILFSMDNSAAPGSNSQYLYVRPANDDVYIYVGAAGTNTSVTVDLNTWYHITIARTDASNVTAYMRSVTGSLLGSVSNTANASGMDATDLMSISSNSYGSEWISGRVGYIKIWSAALTTAEQLQEMFVVRPVRTANLYGWYPVFPGSGERARDYSGNGRNWTENGTLSDEDPPPVAWGAAPLFVPWVTAEVGDLSISEAESLSLSASPSLGLPLGVAVTPDDPAYYKVGPVIVGG